MKRMLVYSGDPSAILQLCWTVNSAPIWGHAARSLLLLDVRGDRADGGGWDVDLELADVNALALDGVMPYAADWSALQPSLPLITA